MSQSEMNALVVNNAIAQLKAIDVDGETMEFILEEIGMTDQILKQLCSRPTNEGVYVLFGHDVSCVADDTNFDAKEIAKEIHKFGNTGYNIVSFEFSDSIEDIIESANGWSDYRLISKEKFDEINNEIVNINPPSQKHIYKKITLHQDTDNVRYFIENEYEKTNTFVHINELQNYIDERLSQGTTIEVIPQPIAKQN